MSRVNVTVTVDAEHRHSLDDVVEALRGCGMEVDQVLSTMGMVAGSVEAGTSGALGEVEGVADVSEAREIRLPPPDSPVQ